VLAAVASGYVLVRIGGRLADADSDGAALWATMLFATLAPVIPAYWARRGYEEAVARLRGGARSAGIGFRARALLIAGPAVVIAFSLVIQGALGAGSYFVTDDWLQIVIAHDAATGSGLDMHYLGRVVYIHFAPGHRFAYWLMDEISPLDWGAALAVMLVLFTASLALFHRICRRLFGSSPWNLILLLMFGTSLLLVPSFLWLADGIHKFPSVLLTLIAIDAYLTYRLEKRRSALAVCVAAVSLGSLFYVKTLLVPLYLVLIRILFLERSPWVALKAMVRERWTWLAFAPTVAIYGANYFANYAHVQAAPPSLELLGKYVWLAWFRGVTPAFAGVHVEFEATSTELAYAFGAQALLIAVIVMSLRRKQSAWRGWVFLAIAFAANAIVIAMGRLGSLGLKQVGSQLRYDTEMTWLFPLAVGFAFFAGEVAGRVSEPSTARRLRLPRLRVRYALLAVAIVAYLAARIDTGTDTAREWRQQNSDQAKAFATNLRHDSERLARAGANLTTLDDQTPAFLIAPSHKPWNRLQRFIPAVAPRLRVVPAHRRPLQVRQNGMVMPIQLQSLSGGRTAVTGAGVVSLRGGRRFGGRGLCVAAGARAATLLFEPERLLRGQSLFGSVDYEMRRGGGRPLRVTAPDGYRAARRLELPLDRRRGRVYANLGHRFRAKLPPGTEACLRSSSVGWITP
jgi:hypothetical protein